MNRFTCLGRRAAFSAAAALCALSLLLGLMTRSASTAVDAGTAAFPQGIAAGDATQSEAVLWAAAAVTGLLTFRVDGLASITRMVTDPAQPVTVTVTGLTPATTVHYSVTNRLGESIAGRFKTPSGEGHRGLRFGVSGDWRGELAPYPALRNATGLDFFVALGDTIYADVPSPAVPGGAARLLADFQAKHAEVYSEHHGLNTLAALRADTLFYATIDDHEVINDFAGGALTSSDPRFPEPSGLINESALYGNGLTAFAQYNPLAVTEWTATGGDGRMDGRPKLYRYRTFGADAALFLLDARSFRDEPLPPAQTLSAIPTFLQQAFTPGRTLLGDAQLAQLKNDLLAAQEAGITWKFVFLPEPIQNLGPMMAQDRYEGYAAERAELLGFVAAAELTNVVFVAADIHGTIVNNLTYQTGAGSAQLPTSAFEITTGPVAYDAPFGPTLIALAVQADLLTPQQQLTYDALTDRVDRDLFVQAVADHLLAAWGYDAVGLSGGAVQAELLAGDYVAVHTFGWSEFVVDAVSQTLTVSTWGIDPYTAAELGMDPGAVVQRVPELVSRFVVTPTLVQQLYLPSVH